MAAGLGRKAQIDDESFDLVTCRIAPHHFVDIDAAIGEAARVLGPGGRYVVVDSMSPELREMFRGASAAAKDHFEIHIDGNAIRRFSDDKIVIRATSPRP